MLTRVLVASVIFIGATGAGYFWRRGRRGASLRKARAVLGSRLPYDIAEGVRFLLFTSRYCIACVELKDALSQTNVEWREFPVETHSRAFRLLGISTTPVLIEVSSDGVVVNFWGPDSVEAAKLAIPAGQRSLTTSVS